MSAGTGVMHSEFNASAFDPVHLLQIWIMPNRMGVVPRYAQTTFPREARLNRLCLIASPDGRNGSLQIHQEARVYAAILQPSTQVEHRYTETRGSWIQVARGSLAVNGQRLEEGDGAAIENETLLHFTPGEEETEFLLFDLP
jgi:redox-sensitive bicupin YhaK (pirin superfamily)